MRPENRQNASEKESLRSLRIRFVAITSLALSFGLVVGISSSWSLSRLVYGPYPNQDAFEGKAIVSAADVESALLNRIALSKRQPNQIALSTLQLPEAEFLRSALSGHSTLEAALNSNPCFLSLADKFYREIREMDIASTLNAGQEIPIPAATDNLKSTEIKGAPTAGWLWQKALATAQGDNGLAMEILSICSLRGDEIQWPSLAKVPLSETRRAQWRELLISRGLEQAKADSILAKLEGYVETAGCPKRSSWMYWPLSLGEDVEYVAKNLPQPEQRQAHYQDVMRNSWLACGLYRKGRSTPFIQDLLIRLTTIETRATRCQNITRLIAKADELKWTELDWTSAAMQSFVKTITETPDICASSATFSSELKDLAPVACRLTNDLQSDEFVSLSREQRAESWRHHAAEIDAALFLTKNPAWKKNQPCQAERSSSDWRGFISTVMYHKCPSSYSLARCARLMQILDSWGRELVIAEDQIQSAVDFASRHCAISSQDVKANACHIQN